LQLGESEPAPTRFLAQTNKEGDEQKALRQFAKFRDGGARYGRTAAEERNESNCNKTNQNRCCECKRVPFCANPPTHDPAKKFAKTRSTGDDRGHNDSGDKRAERIRTAGSTAH